MDISEFLPWALPVAALGVVLGLATQRLVARTLGISPVVGMALVVSAGLIVAATLTPLRLAIETGLAGSGRCDLSRFGLPSADEFAASGASDIIPNVLLFVPLGLAVGWSARSRHGLLLIAVAAASPVVIELTQLVVPALARGCESADVFDNLLGLAVGAATGGISHAVASYLPRGRRRSTTDNTGVV